MLSAAEVVRFDDVSRTFLTGPHVTVEELDVWRQPRLNDGVAPGVDLDGYDLAVLGQVGRRSVDRRT